MLVAVLLHAIHLFSKFFFFEIIFHLSFCSKNDQTENEIVNVTDFKAPTKLIFNINNDIERDIQSACETADK